MKYWQLKRDAQLDMHCQWKTLKYTIFFSGSVDGIKPPNDLDHVSLHSVVPDRSVTVLPALHLNRLEQLEKKGRKLDREIGDVGHRLQLTKQLVNQLHNQHHKAEEGKQNAESEMTVLARKIEDMKGIVPEIFNEAKQIYAEKYAKEEKPAIRALRTDAEKGEVTFEEARKEEVDPAAPENYRIAKENYEQLEDEYKRTKILLEADEQRTVELQDLLETTISMRVSEIQQKFRSYMSLFQFEGQVDWDSHEDKQGRTHFHLYFVYTFSGGGSMFHVQKWGNSLGIRIPKSLALKVGLEEGSEIDLDVENGHLVIKPKSTTLGELLTQVTPENLHEEVSTGEPEGREAW
ncbi:AbrB/MazE/SpoVT family DNA-binding domain-containing protein [Paenibacillus albilobatus]|uniref:AbrB/MazE/SpoVT family DNA-binding domain-containing protein n=1 Tax=Paenibacillus albilobatus TaxID=2716884 RepID=UPI003570DB0C